MAKYLLALLFLPSIQCAIHCYEEEKLIYSKHVFIPGMVSASPTDNVILQCIPCENNSTSPKKFWFMKTNFNNTVIQIKMDQNISNVGVNSRHELVISNIQVNNGGFYFCNNDEDDIYHTGIKYLVDVVDASLTYKTGDSGVWENYNEDIVTLNGLFTEDGDHFEVYSKWENWHNACLHDAQEGSVRSRLGHCKIKLKKEYKKMHKVDPYRTSQLFFKPHRLRLSCQSLVFKKHFPDISQKIYNIPGFSLLEKCSLNIFKNKLTIHEHDSIEIGCLSASLNSNVTWYKDRQKVNKHGKRVKIDLFFTLHLSDVSVNEQAVYTCTVEGNKTQQTDLIVIHEGIIYSRKFRAHIIYMSYTFGLATICYFFGLIVSFRAQEALRHFEDHKEPEEESKDFLDPGKVTTQADPEKGTNQPKKTIPPNSAKGEIKEVKNSPSPAKQTSLPGPTEGINPPPVTNLPNPVKGTNSSHPSKGINSPAKTKEKNVPNQAIKTDSPGPSRGTNLPAITKKTK